jgi:hypothetical protein
MRRHSASLTLGFHYIFGAPMPPNRLTIRNRIASVWVCAALVGTIACWARANESGLPGQVRLWLKYQAVGGVVHYTEGSICNAALRINQTVSSQYIVVDENWMIPPAGIRAALHHAARRNDTAAGCWIKPLAGCVGSDFEICKIIIWRGRYNPEIRSVIHVNSGLLSGVLNY